MRQIRERLGVKVFLTYFVIIVVGVIMLASAAEFVAPAAFERHLAQMRIGTDSAAIAKDLFLNFRAAVREALLFAAMAAALVAVLMSLFISRRIVAPIDSMARASRRIAKGQYSERVPVVGQDQLAGLGLAFNEMAHALEDTEQKRRDLIADVAHELKTPLASIKGYMEGLIDGVLAANQETFGLIHREASRLQRLVQDLEELSRLEAGRAQLRPRRVSLERLVVSVVERLRPQFLDKNIAGAVTMPPTPPEILVDEDRISQVLLNVLGNALQYTPSGGAVSINARQEGPFVRLSIADTGAGIAPEHLSHVFERFYRVDKSRSRAGGGTGIGLTIAKHIVDAHGGRMWAESEGAGRGATFYFTVPVAL